MNVSYLITTRAATRTRILSARASAYAYFSSSDSSSSAQLVKQLRSMTGAPMMECKKSLQATGGNDIEKAMEYMRTHGTAKLSTKLQGREASEGMVGLMISSDGKKAALVQVATETDFASRSETFATLVEAIASASMHHDNKTNKVEDMEEILSLSIPSGLSKFNLVKDAMDDAKLSLRENLMISSVQTFDTTTDPSSVLVGYVHNRSPHSNHLGASAALVEMVSAEWKDAPSVEQIRDVGKKLAMHIVAAKPKYLSPTDVPADVLEKEKEILKMQIETSGKKDQKPEVVENIITGRLNKFFEDVCLTNQTHMVEEGNPVVAKYLSKLGLHVKRFELVKI
mmetsp:Transcript_28241/g.40442  ORF Transcript_28241/g.40442 Transcript_28241/m.40442 type:complete len:340 (+) Transcript_28241:43-1062(+)